MKFLLATLIMISSAFAANEWVIETEKHFIATTKVEIKKVVELYPRIVNFDGANISQIKTIDLTDTTYKYVGEHTCPENHPRLKENFVTWEMCFKNGTCMWPMNAPRLFPFDPCGDNN